ncbi:hypothetical protein O3P69_008511 [Scylla paramamosain]|uniref:ATP synthase mitochondrial F1 complex assembly factor 1 n=1 Tax=Scylla paramamosain TaxID=85552 RepID=A0AAW0SKA0_SCYPA
MCSCCSGVCNAWCGSTIVCCRTDSSDRHEQTASQHLQLCHGKGHRGVGEEPILWKICCQDCKVSKKLESILKTDLLQGKTNQEVAYIWTEHFRQKDAVCGIISVETYDKLHEVAMKYSCFVLPLPRDKGYEFIVLQFAGHEVHFTSLVNYQAYKENAPECLTLVHYPDLKEERGIVLMHGEYNKDILNAFEAQFLVNQLQLYYGSGDKERTALLEKFHQSPDQFKHMELVEHLEKLDLSVLSNKSEKEQQ